VKILVIHQGYPGQFINLVPAAQANGHSITILIPAHRGVEPTTGLELATYTLKRGNGHDTLPLAAEFESKLIRAEAVATRASDLKAAGYRPDLILAHPGWGEALLLHTVWPDVPQMHYTEFFHGVPGTDNDFDDCHATTRTWQVASRDVVKNANNVLNLQQMAAGLCPTQFQHSLLPVWAQSKTSVIHDGIDSAWLKPDPNATIAVRPGLTLRNGDPVVTFFNRTFEPYRGIHRFLEAVITVQRRQPDAQFILVGSDQAHVSYGASRTDGRGWLGLLKEQHGDQLNWHKIHVPGFVSHHTLRQIMQISAAHVYLTYPFVLSWSMLEAMSCGALVIGSDTAPVKELVRHEQTGMLVPFSDAQALADQICEALQHPNRFTSMRKQARQLIVDGYDLKQCLREQLNFLETVGSTG